jgi:hypothetical protein
MPALPMSDADDARSSPPQRPSRQPEELLGRRVRYRGDVGRVQEVHLLHGPDVVIAMRDGRLLRVPAPEWEAIELLG